MDGCDAFEWRQQQQQKFILKVDFIEKYVKFGSKVVNCFQIYKLLIPHGRVRTHTQFFIFID
jgi:hypothetical protein